MRAARFVRSSFIEVRNHLLCHSGDGQCGALTEASNFVLTLSNDVLMPVGPVRSGWHTDTLHGNQPIGIL